MNLGEKQKAVLKKAVVDKESASVTFSMARSVYGNRSAARDCLNGLEAKGILEEVKGGSEFKNNGNLYKITNLPEEHYDQWVGH